MSAAINGLDLREVLGELRDFVRSRLGDVAGSAAGTKPTVEQLETAILAALSGEAKNSQEILTAVALASAGHLKTTDAATHSAIAKLVDAGLISSKSKGDRKIYSLTEGGRDALKVAGEKLSETSANPTADASGKRTFNFNIESCDRDFLKAAAKLAPALNDIVQTGSREQQQRATVLLEETRRQMHVILAEG